MSRPTRADTTRRVLQRPRRLMAGLMAAATCGCSMSQADAPERAPAPSERPATTAAATTDVEPVARPKPDSMGAWIRGFRPKALAAGIPAEVFDRAFRGVRRNATVIERDRFQPEFSRPIWQYLDSAVSQSRVANGRAAAAARGPLLARLEQTYGVDRSVIAAIWGLETAYGEIRGDMGVIESLATLAYDGRRAKFGEEQLLAALRILASGDTAPERMVGSWAGAMGHTQFIPTSYLEYAVDVTGDGRRDIWGDDPSDSLGSTANYLARFGWTLGQPAVRRIALPEGFDYTLADQSIRRPVSAWQALGIRPLAGPLPEAEAAVLLPAGANGPAWLAYPNFRVIKRYNNATSYALAVALLAEEIGRRGEGIAGLAWPRGDKPLSRSETVELQRALTALGYDTQGADGIVGPNTRAAVRAFQRRAGVTPDGYITQTLLGRVRAAGG